MHRLQRYSPRPLTVSVAPSVSGRGEGGERSAGRGKGPSGSRQPREGDETSGSFSSSAGKLNESRQYNYFHYVSANAAIDALVFVCVGGPGSEGGAGEGQQAAPFGNGAAREPAGRRRQECKNLPLGTPLSSLYLSLQRVTAYPLPPHQVHELERTRRTLDTEAQNLRVQTQELEEELTEAENSRLRLEVTLQALKAQFERELSTSEEKGEEKRRALSKQVERGGREGNTCCCCSLSPNHAKHSHPRPPPGEGAGDPAGGGEDSAVSGVVVQEAAGG